MHADSCRMPGASDAFVLGDRLRKIFISIFTLAHSLPCSQLISRQWGGSGGRAKRRRAACGGCCPLVLWKRRSTCARWVCLCTGTDEFLIQQLVLSSDLVSLHLSCTGHHVSSLHSSFPNPIDRRHLKLSACPYWSAAQFHAKHVLLT